MHSGRSRRNHTRTGKSACATFKPPPSACRYPPVLGRGLLKEEPLSMRRCNGAEEEIAEDTEDDGPGTTTLRGNRRIADGRVD